MMRDKIVRLCCDCTGSDQFDLMLYELLGEIVDDETCVASSGAIDSCYLHLVGCDKLGEDHLGVDGIDA